MRPGQQLVGDFGQHQIAGRMTERILDRLEPVEVDEQHRELVLVGQREAPRSALLGASRPAPAGLSTL